jgi:hypothetical protein
MPESIDTVTLEIPARIADLAFRISIPSDWQSHEPPQEEVDFSSPGTFFPLLIAAAPWAAVVLTLAARPGFEDGTLQDWSLFLLDSQGIRPTEFGPAAIGNVQGLAGRGRQQQDETWLDIRFAFFEDGGRLVHLGLLAPEAISAPLEPVWRNALQNFVLERPQGQNVPLGPGMGISPQPVEDAPAVDESAVPSAPEPAAAVMPESVTPESIPAEQNQFTDSDLGYYAKSDDLTTLDPEHPTNARLRDQGVGFVPNVLETDLKAKTAKLGAGAIQAMIGVALGWHVNDDGRRTLILDPDGKIQISLHLIAKEGRGVDQILDDVQAEAVQSYPDPEFRRLEDQGIWALVVRNIAVNNEPIEQIHMLTTWAKDTAMLRARVTADPASMGFAVNYAALILKSAEYGIQDQAESPAEPEKIDGPPWWQRAVLLEHEDRLEEAERLLRDSIPNIHCAIQIAELYRLRWARLAGSDPVKAGEARKKAADWAYTYAGWATSGGEGAALSLARDEFLGKLGPEPL